LLFFDQLSLLHCRIQFQEGLNALNCQLNHLKVSISEVFYLKFLTLKEVLPLQAIDLILDESISVYHMCSHEVLSFLCRSHPLKHLLVNFYCVVQYVKECLLNLRLVTHGAF
jgi:hypothetical protein